MVPPMKFFFHPLVPQRKQEKLTKMSLWPKCLWPKCHSGQSVSLAKVSLWPKCHSGQSVTGQTVSGQSVSGQKVTLAKLSIWPKCPGQSVSGQSVILAKVWFSPQNIWTLPKNTYHIWSKFCAICILPQFFPPLHKLTCHILDISELVGLWKAYFLLFVGSRKSNRRIWVCKWFT